jgi:hypothetical protein
MSDEPKATVLEVGDVVGEIDGVVHVMGEDGKARPLDGPKLEPKDATLLEWHGAFTKHRDVLVKNPQYKTAFGLSFGGDEHVVQLPSLRNVVAHRALHALSPKDRAALVAKLPKDLDEAHVTPSLLKLFAESELMTKGGKKHAAVPHWEPALQHHIAEHASPEKLAAHHAHALAAK